MRVLSCAKFLALAIMKRIALLLFAPLEVYIYDGSQGIFADIALKMLREIGFQGVVNEGCHSTLPEEQGLNAEYFIATVASQ